MALGLHGLTPLLAVASPSPLWYVTRGTGLIALVLLTATVVLGIWSIGRWSTPTWPRFATAGLHRSLSLLVVSFLAVHILTAELDTFAPVGWPAVVVPFVSHYRPVWQGLGTLAFDLVLALVVTSLLRRRINYRVWRGIHWVAYLCWPVALLHGLGTGTDAHLGWVLGLYVACVAVVVVAGGWRLTQGWPAGARARLVSGTAGAVGVVALVAWMVTGPLRPGWARRAGTPPSLLASASRPASSGANTGSSSFGSAPSHGTPGVPAVPFSASLSGTVVQDGPDPSGRVVVRVDTTLAGGAAGSLDITLRGQPSNDGGVAMESSAVAFGPPASPELYRGRIVSLNGDQLLASVQSSSGQAIDLAVALQIDPSSGSARGTVRGEEAPAAAGPSR